MSGDRIQQAIDKAVADEESAVRDMRTLAFGGDISGAAHAMARAIDASILAKYLRKPV